MSLENVDILAFLNTKGASNSQKTTYWTAPYDKSISIFKKYQVHLIKTERTLLNALLYFFF